VDDKIWLIAVVLKKVEDFYIFAFSGKITTVIKNLHEKRLFLEGTRFDSRFDEV
jgi:hypothetical protein